MVRLFHVSDVHFGREDRAAIAWFNDLVHKEQPDAVVMTGDLTIRARRREFADGLAWLQGLGVPVTVEVGNHDLPYYNLFERFARPYRRYRSVEDMIEKPLELPGVTIVPMVTTARFQWRFNWSKGYVAKRELAKAVALARAARPGTRVFIACHHPLIEPHTRMSAQTHRGAEALQALAEAGADAVLTGHVHDPFDIAHDAAGHQIRLIGAGTLSERTRETPPSFNEIRVGAEGFSVKVRTLAPEPDVKLPVEQAA